MQVDILISNVKHDLIAEINSYLKDGWELRGELIVTAYPEYEEEQFQYTQMMTKRA
ncbi:MAG: hypothetical protein WBF77_02295 [Sulfurimonadaceae bacterium]